MTERCIVCGEEIPEGRQVCPVCEHQNKTRVYPCAPEKNTRCKKTACYIYGGPCRTTTHPEYRRKEDATER